MTEVGEASRVIVSEVSKYRLELGRKFEFSVINAKKCDPSTSGFKEAYFKGGS